MPTHYTGTETEKRSLDTFIKLARAAESVNTRINAHLSDSGLTVSQFGVLESLYHLGPMHQNELGQKILKSSGNMTLVIDNLCKRGYVERQRDTQDRRYIQVHLTDVGRALIEELFPLHVQRVVRELSVLSPAEQEELQRLCRKVGLYSAEEAEA